MKLTALMISAFLLCSFSEIENVYDYSIVSVDGTSYNLSDIQGKKYLIFILPATQTSEDSLWLYHIDSINNANNGQLALVGVPSIEDGYVGNVQELVSGWYRTLLDSSIVISKALNTHKSSGASQAGLLQWLTQAEKNGHINNETGGPGSMFFINEHGDLIGVFGPEAKWSNKIINLMMQ